MKTKPIWIFCVITFVIWAINDEFGFGLPEALVDILSIAAVLSFLVGLGVETWKDWVKDYGGIGGAALNLTSLVWKAIVVIAFLAAGVFIITSLFANPMATIIGIFVGGFLLALLFS